MVKPGDKLEGPIPFTVCSTINDLNTFVTIPSFMIDDVTKAAGLIPVWPLGVFVIFTKEGLTICVYGYDEHRKIDVRRNTLELSEEVIPPIGEKIWTMWKDFRFTPEQVLTVNYESLKTLTDANVC